MRASIGAGLLLSAAVGLVIIISASNGLGIEPYALAGVAAGAVIGLVPDRTPLARLGGFVAGFVAVFVGFAVRAMLLPDTTAGRVVAAVATCLLCVLVTGLTRGRLPLWSLLLGVGTFAGVYEAPFAAAEAEMATTSIDVATSLLTAVAAGFAVAVATAARTRVAVIAIPGQRNAETELGAETTEVAR